MSNSALFLVIFAGMAALTALSDRIRFFARHELLTGVLLVGVALTAIVVRMVWATVQLSDSMLRIEVESIESDIDDQLGFAMQRDAEAIAILLRERDVTAASLSRAAELMGLDEINVVDTNGTVVASNVNRTGVPFDGGAVHTAYDALRTGRRGYVKERFRPSVTEPNRDVKYLGVALKSGGFIQLGYSWESFARDLPKYFLRTFEERRVGDTGFYLVANGRRCIALSVAEHPDATGKTLAEVGIEPDVLDKPSYDRFLACIFGQWSLCETYDRIGEWRAFAVLPLKDVVYPALGTASFGSAILIIFCVIFRLMLVKLRRAQGKIDALRAEEESHRAADLALARAIQCGELRTDGTEGEGYRIQSLMHPAREVGGDFYDYFILPDGRLVVAIADVSGKGIPAAFFMMKARTTLRACVHEFPALAEAVACANVRLAQNNLAEMFVTAWIGVYDRQTGTLDYVSAGHNPPLVWHSSTPRDQPSAVEWLEAPRAAALGVFERARYRAAQTKLVPGDRLYLYTDGVTEAMNAAGELFGNDRLESALRVANGPLVPVVLQAVETFVAGAEPSDDITMLELNVE